MYLEKKIASLFADITQSNDRKCTENFIFAKWIIGMDNQTTPSNY